MLPLRKGVEHSQFDLLLASNLELQLYDQSLGPTPVYIA